MEGGSNRGNMMKVKSVKGEISVWSCFSYLKFLLLLLLFLSK